MIVLLDTSTGLCQLVLRDGSWTYESEWRADRELAKGLLGYLQTQLKQNEKTFNDISGIGVFQGPGSFTGLRIGMTILNTIADSESIPIVGTVGNTWQQDALDRLGKGENDMIVLPVYGSDPRITTPRK
jgi:tRNA threonylcarbamoyladenosine biosynthesis protein TsaB